MAAALGTGQAVSMRREEGMRHWQHLEESASASPQLEVFAGLRQRIGQLAIKKNSVRRTRTHQGRHETHQGPRECSESCLDPRPCSRNSLRKEGPRARAADVWSLATSDGRQSVRRAGRANFRGSANAQDRGQ